MEPKSTFSKKNQNTNNGTSEKGLATALAIMAVIALIVMAFK